MTEPINAENVWMLGANPASLDRVVRAWRWYADVADAVAEDIDTPAAAVYDGQWDGQTADLFDQHRRRVTADLRLSAELARRQAGEVELAAGALRTGQLALSEALAQLVGAVDAHVSATGSIVFYPRDDAQTEVVRAGVAHAHALRREIDSTLLSSYAGLGTLTAEWAAVAGTWKAVAAGATEPFILPPEADGTYVIRDGTTAVVGSGPGDDSVRIYVDPSTHEQLVEINGVVHRFPAQTQVVVRTGAGKDTITVVPGTQLRLTLLGGTGADVISGGSGPETILGHTGYDRIHGGDGDDRISGGADRDYIDGYRGSDTLTGGEGTDIIYGLSGNDRLSGGADRDYLEGGTGRDTIDGGHGADVLSGGRGGDVLRGGAGADYVYAGHGTDTVIGGQGWDTSYVELGDRSTGVEQVVTIEIRDLGMGIRVDGSPEFQERVEADLDMLRSSPRGQQMLAAMDEITADPPGRDDATLTIVERFDGNSGVPWPDGRTYTVEYDRDDIVSRDVRPPVAALFHEFAHVYDHGNDTIAPGTYQGADNPGRPNRERVAVGLPVDLDEDGHPDGLYTEHPQPLTENALRREMGWPDRTRY